MDGYEDHFGPDQLSPPAINQLPVEILSKIFELLCGRNEISSFKTEIPASSLGLVCTAWRAVTLTTPSLWSRIYIQADMSKHNILLLDLLLRRSGSSDLYVNNDCYRKHASAALVKTLLRHSDRWVHMDLHVPVPLLPMLTSVKDRLTRLQLLQLVILDDDDYSFSDDDSSSSDESSIVSDDSINVKQKRHAVDTFDPIVYHSFQHAPSLRTIHLRRSSFFAFPWTQIVKYGFRSSEEDWQDLFENARQCANLRSLTFSSILVDRWHRIVPLLELPHLRNLHIECEFDSDQETLTAVMSHISVPSLAFLRVHHEAFKGYFEWPHNIVVALLARSECHLQKLELRSVSITSDELIDLLGKLPKLRILILEEAPDIPEPPLCNEVIQAMFCHDRLPQSTTSGDPSPSSPIGTTLVPLLSFINLKGELCFDDHIFVDMIESRLPKTPMEWLVMSVKLNRPYGTIEMDVTDRMDTLWPRGLEYIVMDHCSGWHVLNDFEDDYDEDRRYPAL